MKTLKIYENLNSNIYSNLAIEEYIMTNLAEDTSAFFLWSNSSTVVIGRNQNQHKECNLEKMEQDNILLARRKTGGGAVFHDLGNLNFSYICNEKENPLEILTLIIQYLNDNQVPVALSGRNDIVTTADKRKISGVAAMQNGCTCLIHGTLLVDVDLNKMETYLTVSQKKLKGIPSVKSRVVNITELNPKLTVETVKNGLIQHIKGQEASSCIQCPLPPENDYANIEMQYKSFDWNHVTPFSYDHKLQKKYSWGELELYVQIKKDTISDLHIFTDSLDYQLIQTIEEQCTNLKLHKIDETFGKIRETFCGNHTFLWSPQQLDRIMSDIKSMFLYF